MKVVTVKVRRKLPRFRELVEELYDLRHGRMGLLAWSVWELPKNELQFLFTERWISPEAQQILTPSHQEFISLLREPTVFSEFSREK